MIALEAAANSKINHMNDWTLEKVAESYVRSNPEAGYEWLMQQETLSDNLLEAGVDGLSSRHPDLADQLMKTVEPKRWQGHFIRDIARSKARKNTEEAMSWAAALPSAWKRSYAYTNVLSVMAREQPEQFLSKLDFLQNFGISPDGHEQLAEAFASGAPDAALNWAKTALDSPATARIFGLAAQEVIKNNPRRIGEILSTLDSSPYKGEMIGSVIEGWFNTDRESALDWVKNQAAQDQIDKIVPEISKKWYNSDKASALEFAKGLPPGEARNSIVKRYVYSDSDRDLKEVAQYIESMESGSALMRSAFSKGTAVRPNEAKALALSIKDPELRDNAIRGAAGTMANIDPKKTAEWISEVEFSTAESLKWTLINIVDHYGRHDFDQMTNWVVSLSNQEKRHLAAMRATQLAKKDDTATFARLLNSAQPGNGRKMTVVRS